MNYFNMPNAFRGSNRKPYSGVMAVPAAAVVLVTPHNVGAKPNNY